MCFFIGTTGKREQKSMRICLIFKRLLKKLLSVIYKFCFLFGSLFFERYWIQTKHVQLSYSNLPDSFSGLRIIQFSDVHLGNFYSLTQLRKAVIHINQLQPDLIFFTGDLYDSEQGIASDDCIPVLSELSAYYGKWAVLGNHDYLSGAKKINHLLQNSGFTVLKNSHQKIECKGKHINIMGQDDWLRGTPNLPKALKGLNADDFTISLVHEPDFADVAASFPIDLQISGHSHGGQVRIPWIGPIVTTKKGRKYVKGLYQIQGSRLQVYANSGLGMTFLPIRFYCRPEVTVFTLTTEKL
jgi:predicted MPP superfamily phosphohydrolase